MSTYEKVLKILDESDQGDQTVNDVSKIKTFLFADEIEQVANGNQQQYAQIIK